MLVKESLAGSSKRKAESEIADMEERLLELDTEMAKPKIATDVAGLTRLSREREELSERLEELYERWERLSEEKEILQKEDE